MQLYPMWQVCSKTYTSSGVNGGSVAEWLGCRTLNPEVAGLSPALTT